MVILAIDPGTAFVGLALLDGDALEVATIKLGGKMDSDERVKVLAKELTNILLDWEPVPDVVLVEGYAAYGLKGSITNAFDMGRVIQCIHDVIFVMYFLEPTPVMARTVRKYITGDHAAKAAQIKRGLEVMGYSGGNEHTRDALALAVYWRDTNG